MNREEKIEKAMDELYNATHSRDSACVIARYLLSSISYNHLLRAYEDLKEDGVVK